MSANVEIAALQTSVVKLSSERIGADDAIAFLSSPNCGAISVFLGTTRGTETDPTTKRAYQIERFVECNPSAIIVTEGFVF